MMILDPPKKPEVSVFIDGAARGNPGPAGIGIVVKKGPETLLEIDEYVGKITNNQAEYQALIRGLEEVLFLGYKSAHFYSDSELLVNQIKGEYKIKKEHLKPLNLHAKILIKKFDHFSIAHAHREENKRADKLANQALDKLSKADSPLFNF